MCFWNSLLIVPLGQIKPAIPINSLYVLIYLF